MRACGVSIWQVLHAARRCWRSLICVATFAWNETVGAGERAALARGLEPGDQAEGTAPASSPAARSGTTAAPASTTSTASCRAAGQLVGLTIYQLGDDFRPTRVIRAESATWNGRRLGARRRRAPCEFDAEGESRGRRATPAGLHAARDARGLPGRLGRGRGVQLPHAARSDREPAGEGRRRLGELGRPPPEDGAARSRASC